jgi:hypothetical protein
MSEMFVMRRANGDLFTQERGRKLYVPVWSSEEALSRYKERNPELLIFLPMRLTRSVINKVEGGSHNVRAEFLLLDENDPDADLGDGEPISLEEIFPGGKQAPQSAPLEL